jgi:hypothetical protein
MKTLIGRVLAPHVAESHWDFATIASCPEICFDDGICRRLRALPHFQSGSGSVSLARRRTPLHRTFDKAGRLTAPEAVLAQRLNDVLLAAPTGMAVQQRLAVLIDDREARLIPTRRAGTGVSTFTG